MILVDLFCGRGGWTKGFMERGWHCIGYDLNPQPEYPSEFRQADVLTLTERDLADADFLTCSSPCEQFSVHCMKHFHPNPKHPELGIKLFNHSRDILEASGKPYIMENVRCAERFVGRSVNHCGPFYLWGNAVPAVMPRTLYVLSKGFGSMSTEHYHANLSRISPHIRAKNTATVPGELSAYIAQQAERMVVGGVEG